MYYFQVSFNHFYPGYYLFPFLSFPRSSASSLPACESGWWRRRLAGSPLCSDWSNGGPGSSGQDMLQPICAFSATRDHQKLWAGISEWGEQFQWLDSNVCALHSSKSHHYYYNCIERQKQHKIYWANMHIHVLYTIPLKSWTVLHFYLFYKYYRADVTFWGLLLLKNSCFVLMIRVCFVLLSKLLVARLKEAFNNAKLNRDDDLRNTLILTTGEIGRYRWPFVCTQENWRAP